MAIWTVPGTVVRVVDGDTVRLRLDLGFGIWTEKNTRIIGVNSPEMDTDAGKAAKAWAVALLPAGTPVTLLSHRLDQYGRPLGSLRYGKDRTDYGTALLAAGHAVVLNY